MAYQVRSRQGASRVGKLNWVVLEPGCIVLLLLIFLIFPSIRLLPSLDYFIFALASHVR